ncbi:MAG TPA: hypothetical protein VK994_03180 [Bacteroidales bacterium]|nr:hypothetical protein [Bacteroidales bacterium]
MKTLKLSMIAAILAVAMISFAGTTPKPAQVKHVIKITLAQAVQEPGLVNAMRDQLDMSFLKLDQHGLYSAYCVYNQNVYKIYGTRDAWVKFFLNKKPKITSINTFHQ